MALTAGKIVTAHLVPNERRGIMPKAASDEHNLIREMLYP